MLKFDFKHWVKNNWPNLAIFALASILYYTFAKKKPAIQESPSEEIPDPDQEKSTSDWGALS